MMLNSNLSVSNLWDSRWFKSRSTRNFSLGNFSSTLRVLIIVVGRFKILTLFSGTRVRNASCSFLIPGAKLEQILMIVEQILMILIRFCSKTIEKLKIWKNKSSTRFLRIGWAVWSAEHAFYVIFIQHKPNTKSLKMLGEKVKTNWILLRKNRM